MASKKGAASSSAGEGLANHFAGKTVEQAYQKLTQLEHVLKRPDTYIGSIEKSTEKLWVFNPDTDRMIHRDITFVPGLYKIFDEILVNAADNKQRDPSMKFIKVDINPEQGFISVMNDGAGIPIEIHKEHGVYVPELIFGHLLTSSNYDDSAKKVTGGRNGYGAKLTNIFSTKFIIETQNSRQGKKYTQVFEKNMTKINDPSIKSIADEKDFTKVTFYPDFRRFGMDEGLDNDTVALLTKRVYDLAGCTAKDVRVFLNGKRLPLSSFEEYVKMYLEADSMWIHEKVGDRWEVVLSASDGNQFSQVSFVNSICTIKGGNHVTMVSDQIVQTLVEAVKKKVKGTEIKPVFVKSHMWLFVNSLIENPAFDSQTKETLTSKVSSFGSKCELSEAFLKKAAKSKIVEEIKAFAQAKAMKSLSKTDGTKKLRISGISKLDDANDAGGRNSQLCTLIITEGDSAKALAVSGLGVVGRDRYGVFPLKGKPLNVRDANAQQVLKNEEISNLKQILGLKNGIVYDENNLKTLRYGSLVVMSDQDHDGSHIKGLVINFIHHFWPSLLKIPGFLREFITPIVKVTRAGRAPISFFTIPEYEQWKEQNNNGKGWTIKYYKGLGTSTANEAKEYFGDLDRHMIEFNYEGEEDDKAIEMAFSKDKADDRKEWLKAFEDGTFVDHSIGSLSYSDFVNKELILFSRADCMRSIPCVVDGFKPSQRKVLFACFKRKLVKEIKVAQLCGYVAEQSAYHHGEASLSGTIVNMAQNYIGSNNVNLLYPSGQFGTRLQGGKDAASARYIFTRLCDIARALFNVHDDALLDYLDDDGQSIEPKWYMPILPFVLLNGSSGIGTGYSSSIPAYNPRDIVANLKRMIKGEAPEVMHPWYRGFNGTIEQANANRYNVQGSFNKMNDTTVEITELPVGMWTQDYKEFLEKLMNGDEKKAPSILDFKEHHTDTTVHFVVYLSAEQMAKAESEGFVKFFKLHDSIATSNLTLFDANGVIRKYDSVAEILQEFFAHRLKYYAKRKAYLVDKLQEEFDELDNKMRFILAVVQGELTINKRKRDELVRELRSRGYKEISSSASAAAKASSASAMEESDESDVEASAASGKGGAASSSAAESSSGYNYLLRMPLWSLTFEKVEQLRQQLKQKQSELEQLLATTEHTMWERDLDNFIECLEVSEKAEEEGRVNSTKKAKKTYESKKGKKPAARPGARKATKKSSDDEEDSESDNGTNLKSRFGFSGMDDDDEDEYVPASQKAKKAAAKPAAAPAVKKASPPKKAASAPSPKKPAAAPKPAAAGAKKINDFFTKKADAIVLDDDEDDSLPLSQRLAARSGGAAASSSAAAPAKAKAAPKAKAAAAPKLAAAPKPAAAKKKSAKDESDGDDSDDDFKMDEDSDIEDLTEPSIAVSRPARSAATKRKVMSKSEDDEEEEEEDDDEGSDDSLDFLDEESDYDSDDGGKSKGKGKAKAAAAPAAKKPAAEKKAPAPKPAPAAKKPAASKKKVGSDDEDDDFMEDEKKSKPKAAAKKPAAAKKKEDDDEDDVMEAKPAAKGKAAAAKKPAAPAKGKGKKDEADKPSPPKRRKTTKMDLDEEDSGSDAEVVQPKKSAAAARPARATAAKKSIYKIDLSDEDSVSSADDGDDDFAFDDE